MLYFLTYYGDSQTCMGIEQYNVLQILRKAQTERWQLKGNYSVFILPFCPKCGSGNQTAEAGEKDFLFTEESHLIPLTK